MTARLLTWMTVVVLSGVACTHLPRGQASHEMTAAAFWKCGPATPGSDVRAALLIHQNNGIDTVELDAQWYEGGASAPRKLTGTIDGDLAQLSFGETDGAGSVELKILPDGLSAQLYLERPGAVPQELTCYAARFWPNEAAAHAGGKMDPQGEQIRCRSGDTQDCFFLQSLVGTSGDYSASDYITHRACDWGDLHSCVLRGTSPLGDGPARYQIPADICRDGTVNVAQCVEAYRAEGHKSPKEILLLEQTLCGPEGTPVACERLANAMGSKQEDPALRHPDWAMVYARRACEDLEGRCLGLAAIYIGGEGVPTDPKAAQAALELGCKHEKEHAWVSNGENLACKDLESLTKLLAKSQPAPQAGPGAAAPAEPAAEADEKVIDVPVAGNVRFAATKEGLFLMSEAGTFFSRDDGNTWLPSDPTQGAESLISIVQVGKGFLGVTSIGQVRKAEQPQGPWKEVKRNFVGVNPTLPMIGDGKFAYAAVLGSVFRSLDGIKWTEVKLAAKAIPRQLEADFDGHLIIAADDEEGTILLESEDQGRHWKQLDRPPGHLCYVNAPDLSALTVFCADGNFWREAGNADWSHSDEGAGQEMEFSDATLRVGRGITTNGGQTWWVLPPSSDPQPVPGYYFSRKTKTALMLRHHGDKVVLTRTGKLKEVGGLSAVK